MVSEWSKRVEQLQSSHSEALIAREQHYATLHLNGHAVHTGLVSSGSDVSLRPWAGMHVPVSS